MSEHCFCKRTDVQICPQHGKLRTLFEQFKSDWGVTAHECVAIDNGALILAARIISIYRNNYYETNEKEVMESLIRESCNIIENPNHPDHEQFRTSAEARNDD